MMNQSALTAVGEMKVVRDGIVEAVAHRQFIEKIKTFLVHFEQHLQVGIRAVEIIETDYDGQKGGISLRVISDGNGQTRLRITNANGQTLSIYDVSGAPVKRIKVDGVDKTYELNLRKGCYIVKVGNVVRKVSVS